MPTRGDWLPSEQRWLEDIAERVLSGEVILVRSLPRWGLTTACKSVSRMLGDTAVVIDGRSFTEESQKAKRQELDAKVDEAVARAGFAQLIFDDYGRALRRSQGGHLHSVLYRLLVDGTSARDIGALLIARAGDMLDLNFAGSPLLSRADSLALPQLDEGDAAALNLELVDVRRTAGESTWLARRFVGVTARSGRVSCVEHLNNDRRRIVDALPAAAIEVLTGARAYHTADAVSQEALQCLGRVEGESQFDLADLVAESKILEEVQTQSPGWPASRDASVCRFADLLAGVDDAIWVDRYALSRPRRVRQFLDQLREHTSARIRMLVSRDLDRPDFASEIATELTGSSSVEVRFMDRVDRHNLHDRHLILPSMGSGFVVPTAGVILGLDQPGSAISVAMPALAIDYATCWRRAERVFPADTG